MGRATWSEAIGAGQIILLIDGFQHHRHGSLSDLVLEGRDAERPLRTVRLQNVGPADRRCLIPARLDAIEEVTKIGLQVRLIDRRRDTVDAGSPILAGQPVGLLHPVHIDDMVQRVQRLSAPSPRQFGYPLSFGGQVRRVQCPLPCFRSTVLSPWRLPSLHRVPVSPVPRLPRYYEGATTSCARIPGPLWIRFQAPHAPPCSCSPRRSRSGRGPLPGLGVLVSRSVPSPAVCTWAHTGSLRFPGVPSHTFARLSDPGRTGSTSPLTVLPMLPPGPTRRRLQRTVISGLNPGLRYPLPTLHERRHRHPCKARFRLAGCSLCREGVEPSGTRRKVSGYIRPPFQDLS